MLFLSEVAQPIGLEYVHSWFKQHLKISDEQFRQEISLLCIFREQFTEQSLAVSLSAWLFIEEMQIVIALAL